MGWVRSSLLGGGIMEYRAVLALQVSLSMQYSLSVAGTAHWLVKCDMSAAPARRDDWQEPIRESAVQDGVEPTV